MEPTCTDLTTPRGITVTLPYSISQETDDKTGVYFFPIDFCKDPQYPILSVKIVNDPCDRYNVTFGNSDVNFIISDQLKIISSNAKSKYLPFYTNRFFFQSECISREETCDSKRYPVFSIDINIIDTQASVIHTDTYSIKFNICTLELISRGVTVTFKRVYTTGLPFIPIRLMSNFSLSNNKTVIPYIDIFGQTLIDFSDAGNIIFTIKDKFTYYEETPISKNGCVIPYVSNNFKITRFEKACPLMISVLRGKGLTLIDKANTLQTNKPFPEFYKYLILYGMLKYLLSRILYGKFDINFLLRKYNNKFLKYLSNSRFCSFVILFNDPQSPIFGYNSYFK